MSDYGRWVRWLLLGITLAISVVLAGTLWLSYRNADRAAGIISDSQGKALIHATHNALHRVPVTEASRDLEALLARDRAVGRRYVAVVVGNRLITSQAGEPSDPAWLSRNPIETTPIDVSVAIDGGRMRIVDVRPEPLNRRLEKPRPGSRPDERPPGAPPPSSPPAEEIDGQMAPSMLSRPGLKVYLVTEFEPLLGNELRDKARLALLAGASATLALIIAAIVLTRILQQRDDLQERLERDRRLAALGEMSAVLAHEIRNPLASLKGHAQLLLEVLPADGREHKKAERVVRDALRLETLTTDLLDFVRAGQVERRAIDPAALLLDAVESVDSARFDVDLDAAPESWPLDPEKMRQVLVNVLDNAVKASEATSCVKAAVRIEQAQLTFEVRDFGGGLPAGEENRIFEPFHTRRARGTGLGLAVARRIVELHHGTITAENHPEGGALFRISIPADVMWQNRAQ